MTRTPLLAQLPFDFSLPGLVLFLLLGLLVFAALHVLRTLVIQLPTTRASRERLSRLLPLGEALIALVYVLSAVPMVFGEQDEYAPIGLALVLLGIAWVSWFAIRDYISGIVLRAGQLCRLGDTIEIDGIRGRITRVGARTLTLRTGGGQEAIIPFGRAAGKALKRIPRADGAHRHAFEVIGPDDPATAGLVLTTLRNAALNHHFASMAHEPRCEWLGGGRYEVTVFALAEARAPEVEAAVRAALSNLPRRHAS